LNKKIKKEVKKRKKVRKKKRKNQKRKVIFWELKLKRVRTSLDGIKKLL
jgi:hypothetical protein